MVTDGFKPDKPQGIESKRILNSVSALELCAYTNTVVERETKTICHLKR